LILLLVCVSPTPGVAHALERRVKLAVHNQRDLYLPSQRCHTHLLQQQQAGALPVGTRLAGLRQCLHVGVGVGNGTKDPAVFRRSVSFSERYSLGNSPPSRPSR
jgi:hypothetical protein